MIHAYCCICQESFNNKSEISVLHCGHIFHFNCISVWLKTKSSCPNCRCLGVNNFIKKIYFDQVSDLNSSCADNTQNSFEEVSELRSDVTRLQLEISELKKQNGELSSKNNNFTNELLQIKVSQQRIILTMTHTIDEKDEEIKRCKNKIYSLRSINDILNKSEEKVRSKIDKVLSSPDPISAVRDLCSSLMLLKKDAIFYKEKSDELTKSLSVSEMNGRLLASRAVSIVPTVDPEDSSSFKTPIRTVTRALSTPQRLVQGSPDTPSSAAKRLINEEAVLANPFSRGGASKRAKVDLSALGIMRGRAHLLEKRRP